MADSPRPLPVRRPELVSWQSREAGRYLVRDRQAGESFALGEEEHFLLERLDGRHTTDDICRAFAAHFGAPLAEEDLADFLELASERGFLQPPQAGLAETVAGPLARAAGAPGRPSLGKRLASGSLRLLSASLRWPTGLLGAAAARLDLWRLSRLDYVPRPDDVFIVTYPRSGTTWVQMILYQLTTDGSMDMPHIAEFCPWFEKSQRSGQAFETRPSPRLFKSHLSYQQIPKGPCRYLYVARDGRDVAVSYYHLYRRYNGYTGTFPEFFDLFLRGKVEFGSWFQHVAGWQAHRHDPNVLFLTYEELTNNLEGCVRRIASFCGFPVSEERMPGILERCSFGFMKRHEARFDPALESLWEQGTQLNSFLRNGKVGEGAVHLTRQQEARFDEALRRHRGRMGEGLPRRMSNPGQAQ